MRPGGAGGVRHRFAAAWATGLRVGTQVRRDPRTVALIILVPSLLETLLKELFAGQPQVFQHVGAPLLGLFPLISMFLVTSVTMLRERTSGTLERLMTMPLRKIDLLAGYAGAFAVLAAIQATLVSLLAFGLLGLDVAGPKWAVVVLAIANAILGMALGLFVSAFARTEFQAVQFMPAIILPQLLLCGLFVAREDMAGWLRVISALLPLTYAYDALAKVAAGGPYGARFAADVAVVLGSIVAALALGAATLRRRTG
jgi:ABC-2 type transport system permease protein